MLLHEDWRRKDQDEIHKTALKTLIKLPNLRHTTHNCRVMGNVWGLCLQSAHTRHISPTYIVYVAHVQPVSRLQLLLSNAH